MARIRLECDQRVLKPLSEIESALRKHGRLDANEIAILACGPNPVLIELEDMAQAEQLARSLNEILDVQASLEP